RWKFVGNRKPVNCILQSRVELRRGRGEYQTPGAVRPRATSSRASCCPWPGTLPPPVHSRPRRWPGNPAAVMLGLMSDVTGILSAIEQGDPSAAEQLLPLVYDELRQLAAQKLAQEKPGQTLQPTALVHEAYLRLVDVEQAQHWNSRGHFFAAAAEAMRRILVEQARRKSRHKHGGGRQRVPLEEAQPAYRDDAAELLAI